MEAYLRLLFYFATYRFPEGSKVSYVIYNKYTSLDYEEKTTDMTTL